MLKALGKYEGFRSNFGLGQYDVTSAINRTIALYGSPYLYTMHAQLSDCVAYI